MEGPLPAARNGHNEATVSVEFTLTRAEFEGAQRQMMLRSLVIAGASGVMLAVIIAGIVTGSGYAIGVGILWFLLIGAFFLRGPRSAWGHNPVVQGVQRHTFDEGGSTLSFSGRESRVDWAYYSRALQGPAGYQLLRGRRFGLVVPRRAFGSERDELVFIELVRRHVQAGRGWRRLGA
jgi:hypothetical protein